MLANSPASPESVLIPALNVVSEEDESESSPEVSPTPAAMLAPPVKSLAAELGVTDSEEDDESPLREKTAGNVNSKHASHVSKKATTKDKGKASADSVTSSKTRSTVPTATVEKENKVKRSKRHADSASAKPTEAIAKKPKSSSKPALTSAVAVPPKIVPVRVKGGARRVPIDSAEAAPVGPAWKG